MDKKTFGLGMLAGIVVTGVMNVAGSLVAQAINKRNAQKALDALAEMDDEHDGHDTCNCTDGCSGKCDTWMPRRAESEE